MSSNSQEIDQFVAITQASLAEAKRFLTTGVDLQSALENYYAAQAAAEPGQDDALLPSDPYEAQPNMSDPSNQDQDPAGGPRTLDGRPAESLPEGWGKAPAAKKGPAPSGGIATLFNTGLHAGLSGGRPGPPGSEDGDDSDEPQEYFAGGEKSGLAVQDPNQKPGPRGIVRNILSQAANNGPPEPRDSAPRASAFGGSGNVLGSEDEPTQAASQPSGSSQPSTSLPMQPAGAGGPRVAGVSPSAFDSLLGSMFGARAPPPEEESDNDEQEVQSRHLTFWRNGFSIEDGPLLSYDEPANKELLEAIHAGRAPPSVFGVRYNQPLQVLVAQKMNEDYVKPKKIARAFGGEGNRLGSPAPEVVSGTTTPSMPGGFGSGSSNVGSSSSPGGPKSAAFEVDETKPTTSIQLRLGDGTKMVAKVNLSHTIGDLRNFVSAARPDARAFVLQITFPSKELKDESETIEDAKLQNAVIVQRFT